MIFFLLAFVALLGMFYCFSLEDKQGAIAFGIFALLFAFMI